MNEEEKYFDYSMIPGKELNLNQSINDKEPIISIITGYYNAKKYIRQTANSIINQTFPYWEWIIINDGSTEEGTKETLEEIASLDNRIKIYHEKNQGRIITRDIAIAKAKCDLLFILDADDVIDRTMLECSYWTLQTNPKASWVYADLVNFDGQEFLWKQIFNINTEKKENILPVCSLIKKEALLAVGGYGVVDNDVHEDWHLWLRMLEKGYFPIRMNYYGFWYRKKKEGGILDSINKDKKRDKHAREEIAKQAEKIKETFAIAHKEFASKTDVYEINNKLGIKTKINQYEISDVVNSKLREMLEIAKKSLNDLTKKEISYIIISGGIVNMPGFDILAKEIIGDKAAINMIKTIGVRDESYSQALGMIKYFIDKLSIRGKEYTMFDDEKYLDLVENKKNNINNGNTSVFGRLFGYLFDNKED